MEVPLSDWGPAGAVRSVGWLQGKQPPVEQDSVPMKAPGAFLLKAVPLLTLCREDPFWPSGLRKVREKLKGSAWGEEYPNRALGPQASGPTVVSP